MRKSRWIAATHVVMGVACGGGSSRQADGTASGTGIGTATDAAASATTTGNGTSGTSGSATTSKTSGTTSGGGTGFKFDVGGGSGTAGTGGPPVDLCHVSDNMNAVGACNQEAPPDSFEPDVQWTFGTGEQSWVTPLVGNFTDDNGDGEINLCDTPDVLLVANTSVGYAALCNIHVLDGATGTEHFAIPPSENVSCTSTPAFGDIDNDGLPEIVAVWNDNGTYRLKAFEHDGTVKWTNTTDGGSASQFYRESGAIAIHDLDADGSPDIVFNHEAYDANGTLLWEKTNPNPGELEASVGVDLDGDGQMEVVTGHAAYHADGSVYYDNYPMITSQSIPQIGNLDDDPQPEIFVTSGQGIWMLENTGMVKYGPVTPTGVAAGAYLVWQRPGTIHDFDGDDVSEWASSSQTAYAVYQGPAASDVLWQVTVADYSGAAGGTAFDFLGDGIAEAMYADEQYFRIYDGLTGTVLLEQPRGSPTISEYPVVADIDNDGSAEILVVSYSGEPALQAIRDVQDRWIQARRIWNQHAYYVTNVREDSTIPQQPIDNWQTLNTYRTNAQIENGGLCKPTPAG